MIDGLDHCQQLRSLYLHENLIRKMSGLDKLHELVSLNLSDNSITKIEGLDGNQKLETLLLKRNQIGRDGPSDYEYISKLANVTVLDLSYNKIDHDDVEVFLDLLASTPKLAVLYLNGNPIVVTG
jgi:Leucine-rich repeat (LRR) protein